MGLVAEKVDLSRACDSLVVFCCDLNELIAVWFVYRLEFFEAFVTCQDKDVVRTFDERRKFFSGF